MSAESTQSTTTAARRPHIVFLTQDHPLTAAAVGGGPGGIRAHLDLLTGCDVDATLLIVADPLEPHGFDQFAANDEGEWKSLQQRFRRTDLVRLMRRSGRGRGAQRLARALSDPRGYLTSYFDDDSLGALARAIDHANPDAIWAENVLAAALAAQCGGGRRVIYAHHDWVWKVWTITSSHKGVHWQDRLVCWLMRRAEERLVRDVSGVVSMSMHDVLDLRRFNPHSAYLPPVYEQVAIDTESPPRDARIVHLGGMGTPASRIGLERFIDVAWPSLAAAGAPPLSLIGSLTGAPPSLQAKLRASGAECSGFVEDLGTVMRPCDIHIVPWEHNTGTRSKIAVAFSYGQAVVAIRSATSCLPELQDDVNCVLASDLQDMSRLVLELLSDHDRRRRIAHAAHETFIRHYTHAANQERFARLLGDFVEPRDPACGLKALTWNPTP